jgi:Peptidase family S41
MKYFFVQIQLSLNKGKRILFGLLFSVFIITSAKPQDCDCQSNLKYLSKKVELNYPGFADKVNSKTKVRYHKKLFSLHNLAEGKTGIACYYILTEYINFFKDIHLHVDISVSSTDSTLIKDIYKSAPTYHFDTTAFIKKLKTKQESLEGFWELNSQSSYYKIAIVKTKPHEFIGIIIKTNSLFWSPWQIKLRAKKVAQNKYKVFYFLRDHSIREELIDYSGKGRLKLNGSFWEMLYPMAIPDSTTQNTLPVRFSSNKLSDKTMLLQLPNFSVSSRSIIDSVVSALSKSLSETENLIIDVRNNPGGTSYSYYELIKYAYTKPIYLQSGLFKSSDDNIRHYRERLNDTGISDGVKAQLLDIIEKMENNKGELISIENSEPYTFDTILTFPKRIAILANRGSTSATELFILDFRQSGKTLLFGENTGGSVDYLNGNLDQAMPCTYFKYGYPLLKRKGSDKNPIDNIGIKPDVYLAGKEDTWIVQVQKYLEGTKK